MPTICSINTNVPVRPPILHFSRHAIRRVRMQSQRTNSITNTNFAATNPKLLGFPNDISVNSTAFNSGWKYDIRIFGANQAYQIKLLHKEGNRDHIQEYGPIVADHPQSCAPLMDGGYQGMSEFCGGVIPKNGSHSWGFHTDEICAN